MATVRVIIEGNLTLHDGDMLSRLHEAHENAKGLGDEGAQQVWQCVRDILVEAGMVER